MQQKKKFQVTGMTCSACSGAVERAVGKLPGVSTVSVSLMTNQLSVDFDPAVTNPEQIAVAVSHAGYGTIPEDKPKAVTPDVHSLSSMKIRLIASAAFTIPLFYLCMGHMFGWPLPGFFHGDRNLFTLALTQLLLLLPVLFLNSHFFSAGFRALFRGAPNMDSLIAIGSTAATVYGLVSMFRLGYAVVDGDFPMAQHLAMDLYFESAGMILTLITLGKFLETRAKSKTSDAIGKLLALRPDTATIIRDGAELSVSVSELQKGDLIAIRSGETIPVDGIVVEGSCTIDESALTGESIPVAKTIGDRVIGATISKAGYLRFEATEVGSDTMLSKIVTLMEEAASSKAPIAKLADTISRYFVPAVIGIALLAGIGWLIAGAGIPYALNIMISVLVISCPCALGLATPTAIMVGTGQGAKHGILIKSAETLETAHHITTVVLDKTGTITAGKPEVTDILTFGTKELEFLSIAAGLEEKSEHPLAEAVLQYAKEKAVIPSTVSDFQTIPGLGVTGTVNGEPVLAGNLRLLAQHGVSTTEAEVQGDLLAEAGKTPLYFAKDGHLSGIIAVADPIKPGSAEAVHKLSEMGIEVVMLTGDNKKTAAAIQKQLGLTKAIAEVLPQDKEREVAALMDSGKKVAMVGDGINDAPALARANVGVAIGAGTDIAIESADVVLIKSDLRDLLSLLQLSRATLRNIKQNLFWALFYNSIGIPLAAGIFASALGWTLNPIFAAAAMSLSSVCVVGNALRLKLWKPVLPPLSSQEQTQISPVQTIEKGVSLMTKTMKIEGMMCGHCTGRVKKAMEKLGATEAVVNLEEKTCAVTFSHDVTDEILRDAVIHEGYEVIEIL